MENPARELVRILTRKFNRAAMMQRGNRLRLRGVSTGTRAGEAPLSPKNFATG
jgi:hypothetical protein